jgi:NADH:ubiquinone oxidoreductase subunit 4 (subunit M)
VCDLHDGHRALAGDLITFVIFYELPTLSTYPLVVHRRTPEAPSAGKIYLQYTIPGGALLLVGVVWLHALAGSVEFTERGVLAGISEPDRSALLAIFAILIAGLGVKTALVPLHEGVCLMSPGWLAAAALLTPLVLATALFMASGRFRLWAAAPWAALPGAGLALAPEFRGELPSILLGMRLGLDATGRVFLIFTALL